MRRILLATAALACLTHSAAAQSLTNPMNLSNPVVLNIALLKAMNDGDGVQINFIAPGSGHLGPVTAQHGLDLACSKAANWWNATSTGEMDCANIVVRQSGPGDSSALQIDTENLGGGFLAVQESAASSVDKASNTTTHAIDIQEGVVNVGRDVYGFVSSNNVGQGTDAFLGQSSNGTHMKNLLQGIDNGKVFYAADWSGDTYQTGNAFVGGLATLASARIASAPLTGKAGAYSVTAADCGTVLRDTASGAHAYMVPKGLPLGCTIGVIQAGSGVVTVTGSGITIEEAIGRLHETSARFAQAEILIDSASTALLSGQVR